MLWLAGLGWLVYDKWGISVRLWVQVKLRERACMNYMASPDRVVVEWRSAPAGRLLSEPDYKPIRLGFSNDQTVGVDAQPSTLYPIQRMRRKLKS